MECPYCKGEMAYGYLSSGDMALHWISEADKDLFLGIGSRKVKLYNSRPNSYSTEAYFCEQCKIVIAYTERESGKWWSV